MEAVSSRWIFNARYETERPRHSWNFAAGKVLGKMLGKSKGDAPEKSENPTLAKDLWVKYQRSFPLLVVSSVRDPFLETLVDRY